METPPLLYSYWLPFSRPHISIHPIISTILLKICSCRKPLNQPLACSGWKSAHIKGVPAPPRSTANQIAQWLPFSGRFWLNFRATLHSNIYWSKFPDLLFFFLHQTFSPNPFKVAMLSARSVLRTAARAATVSRMRIVCTFRSNCHGFSSRFSLL